MSINELRARLSHLRRKRQTLLSIGEYQKVKAEIIKVKTEIDILEKSIKKFG